MIEARISHIGAALDALRPGWPFVAQELEARIASLTESLINNNCEQTRGRIKALLDIKNLPDTLHFEREGMRSALSEQDAED